MRRTRSKSVTPVKVNACSPMEPVSDKVLLRDLLTGTCSKEALQLGRTEDLEHLLFKILGMHATGAQGSLDVKPSWWLDDVLPFEDLQNVRAQVHNVLHKWHVSLTAVLDSCVQYYRRTTPKALRTAVGTAGTSRACSPPRKRLRMAGQGEVDVTMSPVVRVRDVLRAKYPVLDKEDFMNFLKLQPAGQAAAAPVSAATKTLRCKYSTKIPFSSVFGKLVMKTDDRYAYSKASCLRKRDWTNRYLRHSEDNVLVTSRNYEVTYKPKKTSVVCRRKYTFPRRQLRQRKNARKALERALIKPVTVRLERFNIQPYLLKLKMCRRVYVSIDKAEIDRANIHL